MKKMNKIVKFGLKTIIYTCIGLCAYGICEGIQIIDEINYM